MKAKHSLDELVTKRIKITSADSAQLVFHLEEITKFYNILKEENPKVAKDPEYFHSRMETDFADFGTMLTWARTMVDRCERILKKAENGAIIIGESKNYPHLQYSEEEGLIETDAYGNKHKGDPIDVML